MNLNSFMPVKLVTGAGCVRSSAKELAKLGNICLIVTGRTSAKASGALQDVIDTLDRNGQSWLLFDEIGQNPKLTDCMTAAEKAIAAGAEKPTVLPQKKKVCSLLVLRWALLAVGIVLLVYGFFAGGTEDVLTKAVNICTECVGLG